MARHAVERMEALPGVPAAAVTCSLPFEPSFGLPRAFTARDTTGAPGVAILNESFARQIVGVVGDVREDGLDQNPGQIM